jgi:hypothetical protein
MDTSINTEFASIEITHICFISVVGLLNWINLDVPSRLEIILKVISTVTRNIRVATCNPTLQPIVPHFIDILPVPCTRSSLIYRIYEVSIFTFWSASGMIDDLEVQIDDSHRQKKILKFGG